MNDVVACCIFMVWLVATDKAMEEKFNSRIQRSENQVGATVDNLTNLCESFVQNSLITLFVFPTVCVCVCLYRYIGWRSREIHTHRRRMKCCMRSRFHLDTVTLVAGCDKTIHRDDD